jgi:hypothetical protein
MIAMLETLAVLAIKKTGNPDIGKALNTLHQRVRALDGRVAFGG